MNDTLRKSGEILKPTDGMKPKSAKTVGVFLYATVDTASAWYDESKWEASCNAAGEENQSELTKEAGKWLGSEVSDLQVSLNADGTTSTYYYLDQNGEAVFEWMERL